MDMDFTQGSGSIFLHAIFYDILSLNSLSFWQFLFFYFSPNYLDYISTLWFFFFFSTYFFVERTGIDIRAGN
jgi:hypothetical protein